MFGLSRENIRFLQPFYFFGALLTVVPYYSFESCSVPCPQFSKVYAAAVACASCSYEIYIVSTVLTKLKFNNSLPLYVIQDLLLWVILLLTQSTSWRPNEWIFLNKSLQEVDGDLKKTKLKVNFVQNASVQFTVWNIFFVSFVAYKAFRRELIGRQFFRVLMEYCYFLVNIIIGNLTAAFKCRYGKLNELLKKATTLDGIKDVRRISSKLNKNLLIFNKIFGWIFTLILAVNTLAILPCFYKMATKINFNDPNERNEFLVSLIATAHLAFVTVTLVMTCDSLKQERETTISLAIECKKEFASGSQEASELQDWIQENKRVRLSAAEFFEVDRRILLTILSTTITYFIVLMQFR